MNKRLVIVFVKNTTLGRVKTRLAASIGDHGAYEVYLDLLQITKNVVANIEMDTWVFFSETIEEADWKASNKYVQEGSDLGERMLNAFKIGFQKGYEEVILIGSDLSDLTTDTIQKAFSVLKNQDTVFGPAKDGGYYLVGMKKLVPEIFKNKPWSQSQLLQDTLLELSDLSVTFDLLEELNDIDTYQDLIASDFYKSNIILQEKIKQLND